MKKYIIIKADTNDADYVSSKHEITEEQIQEIMPVVEAIKKFGRGHNFPSNEYDTKDASTLYGHLEGFDLFNDFTPHGEGGIHTIESIEILTIANEEKLL